MRLSCPALLLLLAACSGGDPPARGRAVLHVGPAPIDQLDLLFVIDKSGSMAAEQVALADSAREAIFAQLEAELGALPDLHIGVITTDAGVGAAAIAGCTADGDGGELQVRDGCTTVDGRFLADAPDGAGGRIRNYTGALDEALSCLTEVGTDGCGFEQPFAAVRRAVAPGNAANAGFLRDDAMLLVVFVSDEDDCSATDLALYAPDEAAFGPVSSFRCFAHGIVCDEDPETPGTKTNCRSREDGEVVVPIAELADELRELKDDPSKVMIAGVVGPDGPVEVILDEGARPALAPACADVDLFGVAPSVRIRELAEAFPARFELRDACGELAGEMARITGAAGRAMAGSTCLPAIARVDERCTAYDVEGFGRDDERRTALPWCRGDGCVEVIADENCADSRTRLARRGERPEGAHLVLECP